MRHKLALSIIIILSIPSFASLLRSGYFSMHDDLQVMRVHQMEKCFSDGQIPCRWAPDMAHGYGQAMFNFYSTFPYYLGVLIRTIAPISIIWTVKTLFLIGLIASGMGMYLLVNRFWGKYAGILSAVLYIYAPYHALDLFVRGALSELFALAILPFLWLGIYETIVKPSYSKIALTALIIASLFTTHNISTMIYAPFTLIWIVYLLVQNRKFSSWLSIFFASLLGVGISAYFLLPIIFEQRFIQTNLFVSDYYDYTAHFVSLKQLFFSRDWGYGPSTFGPNDDLSFQVGWPHWWLVISMIVVLFSFLKQKKYRMFTLLFGLLVFAVFALFLTHQRSIFIWNLLPQLSFVQFPWRFLGLAIFFLSFAAGSLAWKGFKYKRFSTVTIVFITILLNFIYFIPEHFYAELTDQKKLSGTLFEQQQKAAILDYLPKSSPTDPKEKAPNSPTLIDGEAKFSNFYKRSNSFFFDAEVYKEAKISIPIIYYPGWEVIIDGKKIASSPGGEYGTITISLPQGKHIIHGRFQETPLRLAANVITLFSVLGVIALLMLNQNKKII